MLYLTKNSRLGLRENEGRGRNRSERGNPILSQSLLLWGGYEGRENLGQGLVLRQQNGILYTTSSFSLLLIRLKDINNSEVYYNSGQERKEWMSLVIFHLVSGNKKRGQALASKLQYRGNSSPTFRKVPSQLIFPAFCLIRVPNVSTSELKIYQASSTGCDQIICLAPKTLEP